ncbi:MAG: hypothetical protein SVR81_09740 [Chloroflexota bacterium]|nr:hypothetical protein [Chloroflexota bacterium]
MGSFFSPLLTLFYELISRAKVVCSCSVLSTSVQPCGHHPSQGHPIIADAPYEYHPDGLNGSPPSGDIVRLQSKEFGSLPDCGVEDPINALEFDIIPGNPLVDFLICNPHLLKILFPQVWTS